MAKTWNVDCLQIKRGTAEKWASQNPILAVGEFGYDTTNKITKIGDGVRNWSALPYFATTYGSKSFAEDDWALISNIAESGAASSVYAVGDEKNITLTTGEQVTLVILGFNHDTKTSGGKAGITLGLKNSLATTYSMNSSNTNAGGWKSSIMRTSTMALYLSYLPAEVRNVIKPVNKITSAGSQSTTLETTSDSLFLFSMKEVFGTNYYNTTTAYSVNGEGEQYEYYKKYPIPTPNSGTGKFTALTGNTGTFYTSDTNVASGYIDRFGTSRSTTANRYYHYGNSKGLGNSATSANSWWLRSPSSSSSTSFCVVYSNGDAGTSFASLALGVAFGFCI